MEMLRKSKTLRKNPYFKDVYVNEDLTPSQRVADRKLRQERDRKNSELLESKTLNGRTLKFKTCEDGKKRFWGIRNGELKLVLSNIDQEIIASFDLNESVDQNSTEATKETVNKALTNSTNSSHPVATKAAVNKTLTNSAKSSRPKCPIEVPHDPTINIFTAQSVCLSSNHVESARNMQEITLTANVMSSPVVSPDVSMNRSAFSSFSCSSSASSSSSFLSSCSLQQMSPKDSTSFENSSESLVRCPDRTKLNSGTRTLLVLTTRCTCSNLRHLPWNQI
ncbi:hypothetical protein BpHYR1_002785 [Brachionus plicatilis]|uniref:Uncharacterized protein n=1 Tax=Brachionus plicatilis TaxID=10195 RepID=A0A3M7T9U7_BRAPC|nr:hypothetical protein BpHYR1_002785 [Brachionus plicatilis]